MADTTSTKGRRRGDGLGAYRAKRDFGRTPEPAGAAPDAGAGTGPARDPGRAALDEASPAGGGRFVVQRHRARRLHYDLRLEIGGVLVSWAVPKGPTLDPAARHLAVHVEDHPLEYFDFEGVIPEGGYGAGDVIVWDWGTWTPAAKSAGKRPAAGKTDPAAALDAGELHFDLHGEKLKGRFVLVRRDKDRSGKEQWLLVHKKDDDAVAGWDPEEHPESVRTGRTNDDVAAGKPPAKGKARAGGKGPTAAKPGTARKAAAKEGAPGKGKRRAPGTGTAPAANDASPAKSRSRAKSTERSRRKAPAKRGSPSRGDVPGPTAAELEALDGLERQGDWELDGRRLRLTNLDKVLFPARPGEAPVTKRDLIRYHATIAPVMVPYLAGRPINLHRYPDGAGRPGFWHKEIPDYAPEWLPRWRNAEADPGETQVYAVVDSAPALAWMANYGALELHPWTSTVDDPHQPTWAYIDIDPGDNTTFEEILVLARLYRAALEHLDVDALPKVTGRRGIQIWIPIAPGYSFDDTRAWVETVSRAVGATVPEMISWAWQKKDRRGRARLDYTQNAINRTLVAPYSARPAAGGPVSVPIEWEELDDPELRPDRWTLRSVMDRIASIGDPFARLLGVDQELPPL